MPSTTIARWGNSLALRLPQAVVADARLRGGAAVDIMVKNGAVIVRPARPRYTLEELLANYQPEHRHGEAEWGPDVGKERWQ